MPTPPSHDKKLFREVSERIERAIEAYGAGQYDAAMTELRLLQANLVGPAGYVSMEDGAVGNFIQRAIRGSEEDCSVLEMGGFEHSSEPNRTTEASVRGFWHVYRPLMGW